MSAEKYKDSAAVFRAFSDVKRIHIIGMLRRGERCACEILAELEISQPTLSHHMKILCDSGIVLPRKEGKWTHYSISPEGVRHAGNLLKELTDKEA